jgi:hypothetical protein
LPQDRNYRPSPPIPRAYFMKKKKTPILTKSTFFSFFSCVLGFLASQKGTASFIEQHIYQKLTK